MRMLNAIVTFSYLAGVAWCQVPKTNRITSSAIDSADLVFIIDNSGSMWCDHAYVNGNDTEFYHNPLNNPATIDTLTYKVMDDNWHRQPFNENRTVLQYLSKPLQTLEPAGDPYNSRGLLVKAAIDYVAGNSPGSTAGVMGLGTDTMNTQPPLVQNGPANVAKVKSMVLLDSADGTNFASPLDLARKWLTDPQYTRNKKQAIILVSDGSVFLSRDVFNLFNSPMPPIYSIYMQQKGTPDSLNLKRLSDLSGGLFFRWHPDSTQTFQAGINFIMDKILNKEGVAIHQSVRDKKEPNLRNKKYPDLLGRRKLLTGSRRFAPILVGHGM